MKALGNILIVILVTVVGMAGNAWSQENTADRNELQGEFLMDFIIDTETAQTIGGRRIVPITGGRFEGPNLVGTVLNVGADWIKTRADGVSELDVRVTLKTDDEALIYMSYSGILSRSETGTYWRVVPKFETDAEKYRYLNNLIAIGIGKRIDGKTAYSIYKIL
ncbi:hypothetical protein NBRC116493_20400 [Aurantivibrio infirmus]